MPVVFTDTFWNGEGRNLLKPDLACLRQDEETYNVLMFQPNDHITYNTTGIWITNRDLAHNKFYSFLKLAFDQNVELAITPEYSCPWSTLDQVLGENRFPSTNNVWVLGCQSIRPGELQAFIQTRSEITWVLDMELLNRSIVLTPEKFFDPVCILLNTSNANGDNCKLGIIQFKTEMFGGEGFEWERDNSIRGQNIYVVSNQFASTKMAVIICSDSLNNPFDFNFLQNGFFLNDPLLLLHIQLNQKPFQSAYKVYRNQLFTLGDKNYKKEVICLNWAWHIPGGEQYWNHYGGSGFYIKSDQLNLTDDRFNQNQKKGLYYTRWDNMKAHIYFLNYDEHIFLINTTKASQGIANPTQYLRSGPMVRKIFKWEESWVEKNKTSAYFDAVCDSVGEGLGELNCLSESENYINVERIVALSGGDIGFSKVWFTPSALKHMQIKEDEINSRITFTQDPIQEPKNLRERLLLRYATLKHTILTNPANLNPRLRSVELKYVNGDSPDNFLLNLHSTIDQNKGTGVYLGLERPGQAQAVWEALAGLFRDHNLKGNILVWYDHGGQLHKIENGLTPPGIGDNVSRPIPSYKRTSE